MNESGMPMENESGESIAKEWRGGMEIFLLKLFKSFSDFNLFLMRLLFNVFYNYSPAILIQTVG